MIKGFGVCRHLTSLIATALTFHFELERVNEFRFMTLQILDDEPHEENPRPKKRVRKQTSQIDLTNEAASSSGGRLFVPFRALGLVTNHIPFALQTRSYKGATDGPRVHILTCLGRSWAMWDGGKMTLLFIGEQKD